LRALAEGEKSRKKKMIRDKSGGRAPEKGPEKKEALVGLQAGGRRKGDKPGFQRGAACA